MPSLRRRRHSLTVLDLLPFNYVYTANSLYSLANLSFSETRYVLIIFVFKF
jgi:hypothetical protein